MAALTRAQLLANLSRLDTATLARLNEVGELLLMPEKDLLITVTQRQMVQKALDLATAYFPEWRDRSKTDFGRFLVEMFAYFSEKDFYYANVLHRESFLSEMSVFSNAFIRASEYGYYAPLAKSSSASFQLLFEAGGDIVVPTGDLSVGLSGTITQFTNRAPIVVDASLGTRTLTATLYEGTYKTTDAQFNGKDVKIDQRNVDLDSVIVFVENVAYTKVQVFSDSLPGDRHFIALPEDDGTSRIVFGTGTYGYLPQRGEAITIRFVQTSGTQGNTAVLPAFQTRNNGGRQLASATMLTSATTGVDPSTLEDLKANAVGFALAYGSWFNEETLEKVALTYSVFPGVKKVKTLFEGTDAYVYVLFKSHGFSFDIDIYFTSMQNWLIPKGPGGNNVLCAEPGFVSVDDTELTLYVLPEFDKTLVAQIAQDLLIAYTDPQELAEFGENFDLVYISNFLESRISGVQNVIFNKVAGSLSIGNVTVYANQIMKKLDPTTLTINVLDALS